MKTVTGLIRSALQLALRWLVTVLSMGIIAWILPGISFASSETMPRWAVISLAVLLLAVVNTLVRPIVMLFARPLGWIVVLLVAFFLSAVTIVLTANLLPGFNASFGSALLAGIVLAFLNSILSGVLDINEPGSWYQNQIRRQAAKRPFDTSTNPGRGLMLVEIDGLSYWHMRKAIDEGRMPTLQAMIDEDGYQLSRVDCGLPSMTSSCQAGIMFGENHDIPAYRWYDKSKQKLYVSANDAPELNRRYAHGQGLMRGGSSILNMFDGDAKTSLFTMSNMFTGTAEDKKDRADDISTLVLNPYFLSRAFFLFLADFVRELWEALQQKVKNVEPRLNRLAEYYPFVRAAMCGMMREMSSNIAMLQMYRGAPVIYMLYLGYDEVAHHSGPWTTDAFGDLGRLDNSLAQLRKVTRGDTPRPYEFIVLSDHGQSFGATFKQRYGLSIKDFIVTQLPKGTTVAQSIGGDRGGSSLRGVAAELAGVAQSKQANVFDKTAAKQGQKLAELGVEEEDKDVSAKKASVTAYGSGNACQVYFDLYPRKIKLSELEAAYPGMVDALVGHEGIGLVCAYEDDGSILALGKAGRRNLNTGEVTGQDPLQPFVRESGPGTATIEKRVWQLKRVMEFPSAGDLWVISTWYEDGTVAALEELIGNHGGLGGEQTDAFLFHPPDLTVPDTRNAIDVFAILNGRREDDSKE